MVNDDEDKLFLTLFLFNSVKFAYQNGQKIG